MIQTPYRLISPRLLSLYLPEAAHGGIKFSNNEEVKGKVEKWMKGLAGNYFEEATPILRGMMTMSKNSLQYVLM